MNQNWTRRQILSLSGGALLATALPSIGAQPDSAASAARSTSLYRKAFVLDANTLASIGYVGTNEDAQKQLQLIRESGLSAIKSTLGNATGTFEETVADIALAQTLIEKHPDLFVKVTRHADLERAAREHKVAVIFSFEAASMLDDKIERIEMFRQLDVLVMQLTYNRKSPFGFGCLEGDADGLTPLGRDAVAKMNALGVALDLSHANTRTTADGIAASTKPPVFTHAGCRAVFAHPRNKEDREMKALADKGGVMGIYMMPFLTEDTRQPHLDDFLKHMAHALDVCGEDHVGIGTDSIFFEVTDGDLKDIAAQEEQRKKSGVGAPGENRPPYIPDANGPQKLERVTQGLLKRGYSERVVEKILGLNFSRAFKEIWLA